MKTKAIALAAILVTLGVQRAVAETCAVTVPMLSAIDCSQYPPSLMAFCIANKPNLMGMQGCLRAEAKSQSSGAGQGQCMAQSFTYGTGSFSYVRACSQLPPG